MRWIWLLMAYWRTRRMHFPNRAQLEAYQAKKLEKFMDALCRSSPYFSTWKHLPLAQWPLMDKAIMMKNFDTMNTAGLRLADVMDMAMQAERSRDFVPTVRGKTVGLSSGTSGQRGVFLVSPKEKAQWAGTVLARALPDGLLSAERVALFLRANSNLYMTVRSRWLAFEFFDLFQPFDQNVANLVRYHPSIIVAPAQVLRQLALQVLSAEIILEPKRVISVAEVLEPQDRQLIERAFGRPHEIYQATEGFLASSCEQGVLHLNEEYMHIEPEWLDAKSLRFVPVITDFSRFTQPIVRYRLNDILVMRKTPCPCGQVTRALEAIEGRCDDMLLLPGPQGQPIPVFSDFLARALAQALPWDTDYRLVQKGPATLSLLANLDVPELEMVRAHLEMALLRVGVHTPEVKWTLDGRVLAFHPDVKRRRIVREGV